MGAHGGPRPLRNEDQNAIPARAVGGTETVIEQDGKYYRVHTFTEVGESTLEVTRFGQVEYLVVAGGGSGGNATSGGGGAGGLVYSVEQLEKSTIQVTVGSGGTSDKDDDRAPGENGQDSIFGDITAIGGGRPASNIGTPGVDALEGGSGGGGANSRSGTSMGFREGAAGLQPASVSKGFGNSGGTTSSTNRTGGGGGAGEAGKSNGNGGSGLYFGDIFGDSFGENGWFSGGGAGYNGNTSGDNIAMGGIGGGGSGNAGQSSANALSNTGGGGSGHWANAGRSGGNGGSGIVIVRYRIPKSEYEANQ
jgi:hypothetical protein